MSARHLIKAAGRAGLLLIVEGQNLVVEVDGNPPEALMAELRRHKPEILRLLRDPPPEQAPAFSDLYETQADYARRLIIYAKQDGLSLTVNAGRLVIAIGTKNDADLLGELRAHETAVIACLREGFEPGAISINPAQPAEGIRPRIVRVPPFGSNDVPERFKAAWEAMLAHCPPDANPVACQAAATDAADVFSYWGIQLRPLGFVPRDLFDVPRDGKQGGLAWFMKGSPVMALGKGMAQFQDGRIWRGGKATGNG
jgi:hypothetical protein